MNQQKIVRRDGNYHLTYEGVKHTLMNGGSTLINGKIISTLAEMPTEEEFESHLQETANKVLDIRRSINDG